MKKTPQVQRSVPKQSDIIVHPNGEVSISFLWDDYKDLDLQKTKPSRPRPKVDPLAEEATHSQYLDCKMCPKLCGFNRVKAAHPRCGGTSLRLGTWGRTFGDEPEIVGTGGSGAILFSHCPLSCPSCHNPEMVAAGTESTIPDVIEICYKLFEEGAENIQFLSPTVHMPKLKVILRTLKANDFPIPIVFKSSGAESLDSLRSFAGLVDIYLPDFKYGPNSDFAKRARVPNYFADAKITVREMIGQVGKPEFDARGVLKSGVLIRHVMAPLPAPEREAILEYLEGLGESCKLSITDNFVNLE